MSKFHHVTCDCPNCHHTDALEVNTLAKLDEGDHFKPAQEEASNLDGGSPMIWASPEAVKGTMGQSVACPKCGHWFQLRMIIVEAMRLPVQFVSMEDET